MPVLPGLIAKILALVESILDQFVTVTNVGTAGNCDIVLYQTTMQDCGDELIEQITQIIYAGTELVAGILSALTATPAP